MSAPQQPSGQPLTNSRIPSRSAVKDPAREFALMCVQRNYCNKAGAERLLARFYQSRNREVEEGRHDAEDHSDDVTVLGALAVEEGVLTQEQRRAVERSLKGATQIAGFEILEKVGQGGMGAVFRARQVSMDRVVALKILPPRLAQDKKFIDRFIREARSSAKLNHAHIIQGIDVGESSGYYYFAMEFVDGPTVKEMILRQGRLGEAEALRITRQICLALDHAHKHGLVHRDIKPDNIMIAKSTGEEEPVAKLCDLGLAKHSALEEQTEGGKKRALGTPHYISPEQARGEADVDIRSDLYSLGASLYHMVTGRTLFEGDSGHEVMTKHLAEKAPHPSTLVPELSDGLCRLIERMCAKDREDRYPDPQAVLTDIKALEAGKLPPGAQRFKAESSVTHHRLRRGAHAGVSTGPAGRITGRQERVTGTRRWAGIGKTTFFGNRIGSRANKPLVIAATAGICLVLLVSVMALSSGSPPEEKTTAHTAATRRFIRQDRSRPAATALDVDPHLQRAQAVLEELRRKLARLEKDPQAALPLFGPLHSIVKDTPLAKELESLQRQWQAKYLAFVQPLFEAAKTKSEAALRQGRYREALAEIDRFPPEYRQEDAFKPQYDEARAAVFAAAEKRYRNGVAQIKELGAQHRFPQAFEVAQELTHLDLGDYAAQARQLLSELRQQEAVWRELQAKQLLEQAQRQYAAALAELQKITTDSRRHEVLEKSESCLAALRRQERYREARDYLDQDLADLGRARELERLALANLAQRVGETVEFLLGAQWEKAEIVGKGGEGTLRLQVKGATTDISPGQLDPALLVAASGVLEQEKERGPARAAAYYFFVGCLAASKKALEGAKGKEAGHARLRLRLYEQGFAGVDAPLAPTASDLGDLNRKRPEELWALAQKLAQAQRFWEAGEVLAQLEAKFDKSEVVAKNAADIAILRAGIEEGKKKQPRPEPRNKYEQYDSQKLYEVLMDAVGAKQWEEARQALEVLTTKHKKWITENKKEGALDFLGNLIQKNYTPQKSEKESEPQGYKEGALAEVTGLARTRGGLRLANNVGRRVVISSLSPDLPQIVPVPLRRWFGLRLSGLLKVEQPGPYRFSAESDDGLRMWIGDKLVLDHWEGVFRGEQRDPIRLEKGFVPFRVEYNQVAGAFHLRIRWRGPGMDAPQDLGRGKLYHK